MPHPIDEPEIGRLRLTIADMDGRIERQRLRVQRAKLTAPTDTPARKRSSKPAGVEEQEILAAMLAKRQAMQSQLDALQAAPGDQT